MEIFLVIFDAVVASIFTYQAIHTPSTERFSLIGDSFCAGMWFAFFIYSLMSLLL